MITPKITSTEATTTIITVVFPPFPSSVGSMISGSFLPSGSVASGFFALVHAELAT